MGRPWLPRVGRGEPERELAALRGRAVNYDRREVRRPEWNFDAHRSTIAIEPPGPAIHAGPWVVASELLRDYEFTPPELVRGVYDPNVPLLGRDLLLEGRFSALRFQMGVRITSVIVCGDAEHDVFGWGYQTLEGHLERGEIVYRIVKHRDSGRVEFQATSHSQSEPELGPVIRLGWSLFGRRTQLRFYREIQRRLPRLVEEGRTRGPATRGSLAHVPSGVPPHPLDRVALYSYDPARSRLATS